MRHKSGPEGSAETSISREMEKNEWWAIHSVRNQSPPQNSLIYGN